MFAMLSKMYQQDKINETAIDMAVVKGWLNQEQADTITGV